MAQATTQNVNNTNHEDLTDVLKMVDATKTPFFSSLRKGRKPTNVHHEWPIDKLADVDVSTTAEGTDLSDYDNEVEKRQRTGNYITIITKGWKVSDLQVLSNPAGVADEAANSKAKCLAEIKRNIAARFGGDYEMSDGSSSNYASRGIGVFIQNSAQSVNPVPADFRTPSAQINTTGTASLAEADINDVITAVFRQGGNRATSSVYANVNWKKALSALSRSTSDTRYKINQDASENKITRNVTIYEGDFGIIEVIPDLFIGYGSTEAARLARAYYIDDDLVELNWMDPLAHIPGNDEGGGPRGSFKGIVTMSVLNPLGFAKWSATS